MKPYINYNLSDNIFIRNFDANIDENELIWHKDLYDRIVIPIFNNDWLFQYDNQLPIKIDKLIYIPKLTYHRIIKGNSTLSLIIFQ
jgi:hypothetical protein